MEHKIVDFLKSAEAEAQGKRIVQGYAMTGDLDSYDDIILDSALEMAVKDLQSRTTVLLNHDYARPIGKIIEVSMIDSKVFVKILISQGENEVWQKIQEGILNKFSFGFRILESKKTNEIRRISAMEVAEVSIVSVPANSKAELVSAYEEKMMIEEVKKTLNVEDEKQVVPAITELRKQLEVLKSENADLYKSADDFKKDFVEAKKELEKIKSDLLEKDANDFADDLMKKGKIKTETKTRWIDRYKRNPQDAKEIAAELIENSAVDMKIVGSPENLASEEMKRISDLTGGKVSTEIIQKVIEGVK